MIAASERTTDESDAGVLIGQQRMLASHCPRCGIAASTFEDQLNGEVNYLSEKDLAAKQQEFFESMPELIQTLKSGQRTATKDDYDLTFSVKRTKEGNAEDRSKAITYLVTFTVRKELYPNYILKQGLYQ